MTALSEQNITQPRFSIKHLFKRLDFSLFKNKLLIHLLLLSFFINVCNLTLPLAMLQSYDRIIPNNSKATLFFIVLIVMGTAIVELILRMLRAGLSAWSVVRKEYLTNVTLAEKVVQAELTPRNKPHVPFIDFITRTPELAEEHNFMLLLDASFVFVYLLLIAYIANYLVFIPIFFAFLLMQHYFKRESFISRLLVQRKIHHDAQLSFWVDVFSSQFFMKAAGLESSILRKNEALLMNRAKTNYHLNRMNVEFAALTQFFSLLIFFATVGLGSILVIHKYMTLGGLAACSLLTGRCLSPIAQMLSMWKTRFDDHDTKEMIRHVNGLKQEHFSHKTKIQEITGALTLQNIDFSINGHAYLTSLNLSLSAKSCVVILDYERKAYKLFYLLMAFTSPNSGNILLDDQLLGQYALQDLRKQMVYVPEHPELFQGSILDNLTQFQPEKEMFAKKMIREMNLEFLIQSYPEGYATQIGPNADQIFSEGIRSMFALLRALITEPKLIFINQVTLFSNFQTRKMLLNTLTQIKSKMTILISTQDLALLTLGDQTYELKAGQLTPVQVPHD